MTDIASKRSKQEIISSHCYTDLVYDRIRKKLSITSSNSDIESLILDCLQNTDDKNYLVQGKNIYVYNYQDSIRITINSNTCRVITVDKINNKSNNK